MAVDQRELPARSSRRDHFLQVLFTAALVSGLALLAAPWVGAQHLLAIPVATDDACSTDEDTPVVVDVLANDTDADLDSLTITEVTTPTHGSASTDGAVAIYAPTLNYNGPDSFGYTISDGSGGTAAATVVLTVTALNDGPLAIGGSATTAEDESVVIDLGALVTDVETAGADLVYTISVGPDHGLLAGTGMTRTYTPTTNYSGGDSLVYYVTDRGDPDNCGTPGPDCAAALSSLTATVDISITAVNDPPALDPIGDRAVDEGVTIAFTATASDPEAPPETLTYSLPVGPPGASIDPAGGALNWTPTEAQGPGVYSLTVRVTDDGTLSLYDEEQIAVTVTEVNVAPVLDPIGDRDAVEGVTLSLTATATDGDLPTNTLSYSLSGEPAGASIEPASGAFSWTPSEVQGAQTYTFTVRVTDSGVPPASDEGPIAVHVSPVNATPVALDGSTTTAEGTAAAIDLGALASDVETADGDLTYTIVRWPVHGTLGGSGPVRVYTPTQGYRGADGLVYSVTDRGDPDGCGVPGYYCAAALSSVTRTVTINVISRRYLPLVAHRLWCDPYEPNDGYSQAYGPLTPGTVYEAMLCPGDPDDLYYIDLPAACQVTIDLTNVPAGTDYDLSVWDSNREFLASSRRSGNANEQIAWAAAAGTYYVRVWPSSGRSDLQPYHLLVDY